jgi:hypothetical protein
LVIGRLGITAKVPSSARCNARFGQLYNSSFRIFAVIAVFVSLLTGCNPSSGDNPSLPPSTMPTATPTDIWLEVDYGGAYLSTAPAWSFSDTPGWAAAEWAPSGKSCPEVWDVYNNIAVELDPIGRCAILGSSSELQIMIGLKKLLSYSSVAVRIEGRSASTSSSVTFDVYNPATSIGTSGVFGNDWTVHLIELDLGSAMVSGDELQAVRVEPTGGSGTIALVRMRVCVHDAEW